MSEHMSPIPSRIYNAAVGGHVCGPEDVDFGQKIVHLVKYDKSGNEVSFESQVTQANKIYVIHDDFTLSSNVNIPENCVLEFDGGSISGNGNNYTITGNKSNIISGKDKIFNDIILSGNWIFEDIIVEWFGCAVANTDEVNHDSFFNVILSALNIRKNIYFGNSGIYNFKYRLPIKPSEDYHNIKIYGNGWNTNINVTHLQNGKETAIQLYEVQNLTLCDFQFTCSDGDNTYNGEHGVAFMGYNENIIIDNLYIHDFYSGNNYTTDDGGRAISFHQGYEWQFDANWDPVYDPNFRYSATQYVRNVVIRNCRLSHCANGFSYSILSDNGITPSDIADVHIIDNLIEYTDMGIHFAASLHDVDSFVAIVGLYIQNNRLINNTLHINGMLCEDIVINDNIIYGTKVSPLYSISFGISLQSCSNVLITNNKISKCTTGIILKKYSENAVYDCKNVLCSYNVVNSVDYGITNKPDVGSEGILNLVLAYNILSCDIADYDLNQYQAYYRTTLLNCYNRLYADSHFTQDYHGNMKPPKIYQDEGSYVFSTMRNKPLWFNSAGIWQDAQGNPYDTDYSGSTRPTNVKVGTCFFDTSLSPARPIYWDGTDWVDATGATV